MRSTSRLLVGGCIVVLAAGCGSGSLPAGSGVTTLVVGASLALTGPLSAEALLTKEGYDLCQEMVNSRGGVPAGGRRYQLQIKYIDDGSKPDTAAKLVQQFNDQGVKFILGPYGSAATEAVATVTERNGQLLLDAAGSDDKLFDKGRTRMFAPVSPATKYAASMIAAIDELAKPRPKRLAFLSADDGFSKTVTKGGVAEAKQRGFAVVAVEYVENGTDDVRAALRKIKIGKPDVIIGSAHLVEGLALVKQAAELGIRPSGGIAETVAPPTPDFVETLGKAAENVIGSTQWTPRTGGRDEWIGTAHDYVQAFLAKYNRVPEYHNAAGTAGCLALVLGIERGDSVEPDRIRDALAKLDSGTFFGRLKFDRTGKNVAKPMSVVQIQQGKPVTVWPVSDAEAPLIWPASGAPAAPGP